MRNRSENSATQDQLHRIYDSTRLALPNLVPARDEQNKVFRGPIPTEPTDLFLSWGVALTPHEVHAIDPRAVELLHIERGLEIFYYGPESRNQTSVEFCSKRDPESGYEVTRWVIERHDDDPTQLLDYRRSRLAEAFRQDAVDPKTLSDSLNLEFKVGGYDITFAEANVLHSIAVALPGQVNIREVQRPPRHM